MDVAMTANWCDAQHIISLFGVCQEADTDTCVKPGGIVPLHLTSEHVVWLIPVGCCALHANRSKRQTCACGWDSLQWTAWQCGKVLKMVSEGVRCGCVARWQIADLVFVMIVMIVSARHALCTSGGGCACCMVQHTWQPEHTGPHQSTLAASGPT